MARPRLVIFDCDGVLVDSEPIAIAVLCAELARRGVPVTADFAYRNFLGRPWPAVAATITAATGLTVGEEEASAVTSALLRRFESELKPMPGVEAALAALRTRACVASSSRPERLHATLRIAGLLARFDPDVFSAAEVRRGKPAPDLFLHAAARLGVAPSDCLVVEDSPSGIEAARAAGMRVVAFLGGGHVPQADLEPAVLAAGPDAVFSDFARLADVIDAAMADLRPVAADRTGGDGAVSSSSSRHRR